MPRLSTPRMVPTPSVMFFPGSVDACPPMWLLRNFSQLYDELRAGVHWKQHTGRSQIVARYSDTQWQQDERIVTHLAICAVHSRQ